jgi:hypothetical protein
MMKTTTAPKTIRFEIEWPVTEPRDENGDLDADKMEWECEYRDTAREANALARKKMLLAPLHLAYVTRETYCGNGDPESDERGWERDARSREEFNAFD